MTKATTSKATKRSTSNLPVNYKEQMDNEVGNIQSRISAPSGDRIRMVSSSHFVLPDGTEAEEIEGVIVDFVSANLFFEGDYDRENPSAPGCFAVGPEPTTLVPTRNSPNRQADTCSACPNNQFGSKGKGKACKNTRQLALMALDAEDDAIWVMSVPPTSIKAFDGYVHTLAGKHRLPPVGVVTRVKLDKSETYSAPRFEVVRPLDTPELGKFMESRTAARERLVTEPDFSQYTAPAATKGRAGAVRRR